MACQKAIYLCMYSFVRSFIHSSLDRAATRDYVCNALLDGPVVHLNEAGPRPKGGAAAAARRFRSRPAQAHITVFKAGTDKQSINEWMGRPWVWYTEFSGLDAFISGEQTNEKSKPTSPWPEGAWCIYECMYVCMYLYMYVYRCPPASGLTQRIHKFELLTFISYPVPSGLMLPACQGRGEHKKL